MTRQRYHRHESYGDHEDRDLTNSDLENGESDIWITDSRTRTRIERAPIHLRDFYRDCAFYARGFFLIKRATSAAAVVRHVKSLEKHARLRDTLRERDERLIVAGIRSYLGDLKGELRKKLLHCVNLWLRSEEGAAYIHHHRKALTRDPTAEPELPENSYSLDAYLRKIVVDVWENAIDFLREDYYTRDLQHHLDDRGSLLHALVEILFILAHPILVHMAKRCEWDQRGPAWTKIKYADRVWAQCDDLTAHLRIQDLERDRRPENEGRPGLEIGETRRVTNSEWTSNPNKRIRRTQWGGGVELTPAGNGLQRRAQPTNIPASGEARETVPQNQVNGDIGG